MDAEHKIRRLKIAIVYEVYARTCDKTHGQFGAEAMRKWFPNVPGRLVDDAFGQLANEGTQLHYFSHFAALGMEQAVWRTIHDELLQPDHRFVEYVEQGEDWVSAAEDAN